MSFFGGNQNVNMEANKYLDQIPGQVSPYYQPYMDAGKNSLEKLTKQYEDMMSNPGGHFNKLGEGYKQSPGYAATLREALAGANNAAAMGGGGGLGTYGHEQLAAGAAGDVANKDFQQYIENILGIEKSGTEGEQGLETQGFDANKDYASMIAQLLNAKGTNAANQANANNQSNSQIWSNIIQALGTAGGAFLGGPPGAAAGGAVGKKAADAVLPTPTFGGK